MPTVAALSSCLAVLGIFPALQDRTWPAFQVLPAQRTDGRAGGRAPSLALDLLPCRCQQSQQKLAAHTFMWFISYVDISRGLGASVKPWLLVGSGRTMGSATAPSLWHEARSAHLGATLFLWHGIGTESWKCTWFASSL